MIRLIKIDNFSSVNVKEFTEKAKYFTKLDQYKRNFANDYANPNPTDYRLVSWGGWGTLSWMTGGPPHAATAAADAATTSRISASAGIMCQMKRISR